MNPALEEFQKSSDRDDRIRVVVIGGGAAGLSALGALRRNPRINAILLEKSAQIGGVWSTANYPGLATHIKSFAYRFYNFHPPRSKTEYATRDEVLSYFDEYKAAFDLDPHIALEHRVVKITRRQLALKEGAQVEVIVTDSQGHRSTLPCDYIVCALGFINAGKPQLPEFPGQDEFKGQVVHSSQFGTEMLADIRDHDRRVCLLGGGKSAYDLAWLFHREGLADQVTWAYRHLLWGINHEAIYAKDSDILQKLALSGRFFHGMRRHPGDPKVIALAKQLRDSNLFLNLENNFDFHRFRSAHYRESELNLLQDSITRKKLGIQDLVSGGARLDDGSQIDADYVICATGYSRGGSIPPVECIEENGASTIVNAGEQDLLYRSMIDTRTPELIFLAGEEIFPNQLYGFSIVAEWLPEYLGATGKERPSEATLTQELERDWASLNGEVHQDYLYTWIPRPGNVGNAFGRMEASSHYRQQILNDLGIGSQLQTKLSLSLFDSADFEAANQQVAEHLQTSKTGVDETPENEADGDAMENVEDVFGLSPVQEGMLFHSISSRDSGTYLVQLSCQLDRHLDPGLWKECWNNLHQRHGSLRTIFLWEDLDEPLQVVRKTVSLSWNELDWRHEAEIDDNLHALLTSERATPIELNVAPLARFHLIQLPDQSWQFVWTFHHLILDGWSITKLLDELRTDYAARRAGKPATLPEPVPFANYVAALLSQDQRQAESFWRKQLAELSEPTRLTLHAQQKGTGHAHRERDLPPALTANLQAFCRENRLTLNTIVHAAWAVLAARYLGRDEVVIGSIVAGRPSTLPGVEDIMGCCINTLPLRLKVEPECNILDWLREVQQRHLDIREHETSALSSIQKWSPLPANTALFDTLVAFESSPISLTEFASGADLPFHDLKIFDQSNYPLALLAQPMGEEISLRAVYDQSRFDGESIDRLLGHLLSLLESFLELSTATLGELRLLPPSEEQQLLAWEGSEPPSDSPRPASVLETIATQIRERREHAAVCFRGEELSYRELDTRSSRLAAHLLACDARNDRIGLLIDRSFDMIVGILGIMRAGCAYVPLDPAYPSARLEQMLEDSGADLVVSHSRITQALPCKQRLDLDALPEQDTFKPPNIDSEQIAYVIFTSGSTGRANGVGVTHANLSASTAARADHYRNPVGRFLLLSSFAFDSSVAGIFWTLCSGGTLTLPEEKEELDLERIASLISDHKVTHILCLPTLYNLLLEFAPANSLDSLRVVIVAGEECPASLVERHHSLRPHGELHNEYGPTEATVWSTVWKTSLPCPSHAPIGRPIQGTRVQLLDSSGHRVPIGVPGTLHLGGAGITPGNANENGLYNTGDLACWSPNGDLLFLGRADDQIKLRGHRVELGGLEATLTAHPDVTRAAAVLSTPAQSEEAEALMEALERLNPVEADQLLAEITSSSS